MAQTPLELLTVIAAPALITNASSVLVLSTSNRFARGIDRARALAADLAAGHQDTRTRIIVLRGHRLARRRILILIRALTAFYLAVGSFAFGTFTGLVGAAVEHLLYEWLAPYFTAVSLGFVMIGTLAIATGAVMLVIETRLAHSALGIEAGLYQEDAIAP
jgi:hypothetical protein